MPGLAASSLVFENIRLENLNYQLYRLDWIQPKKNESIKSYCLRLSKKIKHISNTEIHERFSALGESPKNSQHAFWERKLLFMSVFIFFFFFFQNFENFIINVSGSRKPQSLLEPVPHDHPS